MILAVDKSGGCGQLGRLGREVGLGVVAGRHAGGVRIEGILRRQSGVISRAQAVAAGLSERQVDRRLAAGRWLSIHPRVYLAADRVLTDEARIRASSLWLGERATLSGIAAAWWHRLLPEPPSTVELTVPATRYVRTRPGIRVRRRDIGWEDRVEVQGLWVTSVPLTVLEAAVALGARGSELLDRALQGRVRLAALYRAHCRNLGRRGAVAAGGMLVAAADQAASAAERKLIALLREGGIGGWRLHYKVAEFELDLAFPQQRVAIEVDGWAWHSDVSRFRNDRRRQNGLVVAGWTVLRFTWHDLTQRREQVLAEIQAMIADSATPPTVAVGGVAELVIKPPD